MPLLHKKHFVENDLPSNLRDSEEVFHCELTNEIFRDYEEFCERIILCNSLVWSCGYTGRSNLTYQEALNSEENAKKMLKEFPLELRIPVLYLTTLTERKSLVEFAEDVFAFARDRYFVGETVEVCFGNDTWCNCHIIQVQYPTHKQLLEHTQQNSIRVGERDYFPPAVVFSYEVEVLDAQNNGLTYFVKADQVRRRKGLYSREKNRLYIKQFVEQPNGIWKLKDSVYHKYGIDRVKFDQIFAGQPPTLKKTKEKSEKNKELLKQIKKEKKQESIQKYFSKQNNKSGGGNQDGKKLTPKKPTDTPQKTLIQKLKNKYKVNNMKNGNLVKKIKDKKDGVVKERKKREKKIKVEVERVLSKEELLKLAFECKEKDRKQQMDFMKEKKLKREEKQQVAEMIKEYNRRKEDLECVMLKDLPVPLPVQTKIPNECFGDFLRALEFFHSFGSVIAMKDFFPGGVTFELLERALVENEVAGPMNDLINLLLTAIFELQEQEDEIEDDVSVSGLESGEKNKMNSEAFKLASAALVYSQHYHGQPLSQLTLDCATLTEVLRLHLLSSGRRRVDENDNQWRSNTLNYDDPCSALCISHPHILIALSQETIHDLPIADKLAVFSALMDQILSFFSVKDVIDERLVKFKAAKFDLRNQQAAEMKRRREALLKLKEQQKEQKDVVPLTDDQKQAQTDSEHRRDNDLARKATQLINQEMEFQVIPLGLDRAYRRFWMFSSMPGLFVEDDEQFPGMCLSKDGISEDDLEQNMKFVRKLFEEGSNKENLAGSKASIRGVGSPSKKLLVEKNGDSVSGRESSGQPKVEANQQGKPFTCWGDNATCPVHSTTRSRTHWSFYKDEADLNNLIDSLNTCGIRESKLRKTLIKQKQRILDSLVKCPLSKLNPSIPEEEVEVRKSARNGPKYDSPNLNFPSGTPIDEILRSSLRDIILETEDKIHAGHLGTLKVFDRQEWRNALLNQKYDKQCNNLFWGYGKEKSLQKHVNLLVDKLKSEERRSQTPVTDFGIDKLLRVEGFTPQEDMSNLACAILQVEQSIELRYFKKPFGLEDCKEKDNITIETCQTMRERWELSLMASSSLSQLFVHLYTLDNHIAWARSALKASCRICRRQRDPDSMLLCDLCNKGHHMYCLKPKLTKIPEGDWFCPVCRPKPPPREKRTRKVVLEDGEEDENITDDKKAKEQTVATGKCKVCRTKGEVAVCDSCDNGFHLDCVNPPLRKYPRFKWTCPNCRHLPPTQPRKDDSTSPSDAERSSRRRSAKAATAKISQFAKQLRANTWEGSAENEEKESEGTRRRSRRSLEAAEGPVVAGNNDLPLDNAALQEILEVLMHHKDAWPFLRPVTKSEVPDYHNIIKTPMDFGTIKHKLNMLEYSKNSQVIADALLVFDNCYMYNQADTDIYKAGERLHKVFEKLCNERKMKMYDIDYEVQPPVAKKARTVF